MMKDDKEFRLMLAAFLLAARLVNKPLGPSDEQIVDSSIRFADLLLAKLT